MARLETEQLQEGAADDTKISKGKTGRKKRLKRVVTDVIVHIHASFNNTIVTVTDVKGNALSQSSGGRSGYAGSRKNSPLAGQMAVEKALQEAKDNYGAESAEVWVWGPGPGRDNSIRVVRNFVAVVAIEDVTTIAFNGPRPAKQRRV